MLLLAVCTTALAQTKIFYVKTVAAGSADGSSWTNASADLQAMMDAAYADAATDVQVWVAEGEYKPTAHPGTATAADGLTDHDKAFVLRPGVKVYGGFDNALTGTAGSLTSRTFETTGSTTGIFHT